MDIKINLAKFKSEIVTTKKGTKCIIIPIDENKLVLGKENAVYAELQGWELTEKKTNEHGFQNTHLIKQKFSKQIYEKLTEEEKRALPIFGNITEYAGKTNEALNPAGKENTDFDENEENNLPF